MKHIIITLILLSLANFSDTGCSFPTATSAIVAHSSHVCASYVVVTSPVTLQGSHNPIDRSVKMNESNLNFVPPSEPHRPPFLPRSDPLVLSLETKARKYNLIYREDIQRLLKMLSYTRNEQVKQHAARRLQLAIDAYEIKIVRQPDSLKPYGPAQLLSQGQLHLLTQIDSVNWLLPVDTPLTGMLILGPQKGGKSRFIVQLCLELRKANPNIVITIIDPKDGFRNYATCIGAVYVDLAKVSLGISRVPGIDYRDVVLEFMPPLADIGGLIYGTEVLNEAADITLHQLGQYIRATGDNDAEICLRDIYVATSLVSQSSSGRRAGYREAAQTVLHRIIGQKNLFATRKGVSLEWLFSRNAVINARCIVDDMTCRALALSFLYWKYQLCRYRPESNQLEHIIIIDDASRFIGTAGDQFESGTRTSPLGHILALLRATGTGLAAATQLPAFIDQSVLALSRTMVVVGGMNGAKHIKVVTAAMGLNEGQVHAIAALNTQEAVGFAPSTAYKLPVHGWVPIVKDMPKYEPSEANEIPQCQPWHNLAELPVIELTTQEYIAEEPEKPQEVSLTGMSEKAESLTYDCVQSPYHSIQSHMKRLNFSGSAFEAAKAEAIQNGYLIQSSAGKTAYLIASKKAFSAFGYEYPHERAVSEEHSFYVGLCVFLLQADPGYKTVKSEVPLGGSGSTSDVLATRMDGTIDAWEITLSTSNVLTNALKYQHTAYSRIVFLARDNQTADAIKRFFAASNIDSDLLSRIEYMFISQLLERQRKLSKY
jgi:hypothetical protein